MHWNTFVQEYTVKIVRIRFQLALVLSGLTSVTPKLDSLVNEVIRSFSLNTLILLNDVITMKLVY